MFSPGAQPAALPVARSTWLALGAIVVLALSIRFATADYSLWYDEIASTRFAATPPRLLWSDWMIRETNPPLYYTLLGGWTALVGGDDRSLRALSILIGSVGIFFAFLLGRRVGGARAGLIAAALLALSQQHVLYSEQIRGYVLAHTAALGAVLAAMAFLEAACRNQASARRRALAGYGAACIVALYSHTTLVLLPVLTSIFVLACLAGHWPRNRAPAVEWIGANAVVALTWLWWAHITLVQAHARATIGWIGVPSVPYAARMTLESYLPWSIGWLQWPVALLAVAAAGLAIWSWRSRPERWLLPFLAIATPALLYLLSLRTPVFLNRTVYWSSAPFLVTVAGGIAAIRPPLPFLAALAAAVAANAAGLVGWLPVREIEPWRAATAAIQRDYPGATVLVRGKGPLLAMQRYCRAPTCTLTIRGVPAPSTDSWASGFAVRGSIGEDAAAALLRRPGRIVAVRWLNQDPVAAPPPGAHADPLPGIAPAGNAITAVLWRRQ